MLLVVGKSIFNKPKKRDKPNRLKKLKQEVSIMLRKEKGFTLIELLIVIAIIGILAAIAIPMYRTQTIKAKMTEVTNAMSNVASAVAAYYQETDGDFPYCPSKADIQNSLGVSTNALTRLGTMSVDSTTGIITAEVVSIDSAVDNSTLELSPITDADGSIRWQWQPGAANPVNPAYVPKR
jgi:type IV pilus assembly protein PilA